MTAYLTHNHAVGPPMAGQKGEVPAIGYLTHDHEIAVAKDGYQVKKHSHILGESFRV